MRFKGTFILLLLCMGLGAYVYFYEIKGGEKREKATKLRLAALRISSTPIRIATALRRVVAFIIQ
jgi:hypothetical protein